MKAESGSGLNALKRVLSSTQSDEVGRLCVLVYKHPKYVVSLPGKPCLLPIHASFVLAPFFAAAAGGGGGGGCSRMEEV